MSMTADVATGVLVGYIRVSTQHQTHAAQWDALTELGIPAERIYADKMTGSREDRPGYQALLAYLRPGDIVTVTSLDRLGRSLSGIIRTIEDLASRGIYVRSERERIDTSTAAGMMLAGVFGALAQYERTLMHERVRAAREAAGESGRTGGRPRVLSADQCGVVVDLRAAGWDVGRIAEHLKVSKRTVYRCLESAALSG